MEVSGQLYVLAALTAKDLVSYSHVPDTVPRKGKLDFSNSDNTMMIV
jgi:hypothetical protein